VVQDAFQEVVPLALYQTKRPGGHGAVREVCDLFERMKMIEE
jgi:3-deoxy-D-manno-octulosonate 8-phosphate phosphatase KdsC-like HAD superfamily phosphatase